MRVLVIPASKHGGTAEIGLEIARVLRNRGIDVDVTQPEDAHDLATYDGFVVGSGLYMGSWLPAARDFVTEHAVGLRSKPTWLFSSGPLGPAKPKEPIDPDFLRHLVETTSAREHELFGGRMELERLGRTERFVARWVGAIDGDYREWPTIESWASAIADALDVAPLDTAKGSRGDQ